MDHAYVISKTQLTENKIDQTTEDFVVETTPLQIVWSLDDAQSIVDALRKANTTLGVYFNYDLCPVTQTMPTPTTAAA